MTFTAFFSFFYVLPPHRTEKKNERQQHSERSAVRELERTQASVRITWKYVICKYTMCIKTNGIVSILLLLTYTHTHIHFSHAKKTLQESGHTNFS